MKNPNSGAPLLIGKILKESYERCSELHGISKPKRPRLSDIAKSKIQNRVHIFTSQEEICKFQKNLMKDVGGVNDASWAGRSF